MHQKLMEHSLKNRFAIRLIKFIGDIPKWVQMLFKCHTNCTSNVIKKMNSLKLMTSFLTIFFPVVMVAQTITGNLTLLLNQPVKLESFNGLISYPVGTTTIDGEGNFQLNYSKSDYGVGYLMSADNKAFFVVLSGEDIEIKGEAFSYPETIKVLKGQENQWFEQYATEHPKREQTLNAWNYLEKFYQSDSLFAIQEAPKQAIQKEIVRIKDEDAGFLATLPIDSYVYWFLPTRKLISSVSVLAQYRPNEISIAIAAFRNMDYTDPRLYKSGLFRDAMESHFWLIENSGKPLDSVFIEMQVSIDSMMETLAKDEKILNEVTNYLFDLLERHSLFQASEYLALKVLNEVNCTIDSDLSKQLETYRAMKKGNIAPDFNFNLDEMEKGSFMHNQPKKLSDINSAYTVVVFGASWCPKCTEELPVIANLYPKWKGKGVEVVFVSLDENEKLFRQFVIDFPFISVCDFKKWDSPIAINYFVFATPTMFLIDEKRTIILRPNSVKQLDAWVDWQISDP
jgi:thiol-disulfide isomerase/thioredoxin